jgi:endogenous inhibitor of DNA gyrase (YacG/DUF329 family)
MYQPYELLHFRLARPVRPFPSMRCRKLLDESEWNKYTILYYKTISIYSWINQS